MNGAPEGPLTGLVVFDLTRILAGPSCTQILGDLGAEIIKVERPGAGDDTRNFAPPYLPKADGEDSSESAYFAGTNRNKRSITLNLSDERGQKIAHDLIAQSDILVENFKTGTLDKYGLGFTDLHERYPNLIYCSVTGFGHTGPYADRPAYDALIQAMGGVMSLTGEPDGAPMKVGVSIADLMSGMYATVAILAAARHQQATGRGQHLDISMLDAHVAWLANQGMNYLATNEAPPRLGNQHPNIVPYQVMPSADGHFVLSVGNDPTFARFCEAAQAPELLDDPRFATAVDRVRNRDDVTETLNELTRAHSTDWWIDRLEAAKVGCGRINTLDQVFSDPQVQARGMVIEMPHPATDGRPAKIIASPLKLSETPVSYRRPPPLLGEHTEEVLAQYLALDAQAVKALRDDGVV
ncbi:MAG: crotonobetainyl-CoA:carnitine CoA-transferase CaiB-like acyl-CoA transferase [Gammaproteobacteria bacterium]|jgi:crotonobetainyl-CoA:carnitine CoA-transferase CaiB-like acyl-CoA transferase